MIVLIFRPTGDELEDLCEEFGAVVRKLDETEISKKQRARFPPNPLFSKQGLFPLPSVTAIDTKSYAGEASIPELSLFLSGVDNAQVVLSHELKIINDPISADALNQENKPLDSAPVFAPPPSYEETVLKPSDEGIEMQPLSERKEMRPIFQADILRQLNLATVSNVPEVTPESMDGGQNEPKRSYKSWCQCPWHKKRHCCCTLSCKIRFPVALLIIFGLVAAMVFIFCT